MIERTQSIVIMQKFDDERQINHLETSSIRRFSFIFPFCMLKLWLSKSSLISEKPREVMDALVEKIPQIEYMAYSTVVARFI